MIETIKVYNLQTRIRGTEIRNFPKNLDPHFFRFNIQEGVEKPPDRNQTNSFLRIFFKKTILRSTSGGRKTNWGTVIRTGKAMWTFWRELKPHWLSWTSKVLTISWSSTRRWPVAFWGCYSTSHWTRSRTSRYPCIPSLKSRETKSPTKNCSENCPKLSQIRRQRSQIFYTNNQNTCFLTLTLYLFNSPYVKLNVYLQRFLDEGISSNFGNRINKSLSS